MYKCGHMSGGLWIGNDASAIFPCCHTTAKGKQYYHHRQFDDLLNHPNLVEIRQAALRGEVHDLCKGCEHLENANLESPRTRANNNYINQGYVKEIIAPEDLEQLYFSLSNVCNFKCVMCSGGNSHLIAKEEKWETPLLVVDDKFLEDLELIIQQAPNIRRVQISGGEPFQHKPRLKRIISILPRSAEFYIHTNGSHFDQEAQEIIKALEEFESANIAYSIDGTDGVFEYQRTGGEWTQVLANLEEFNRVINTERVFATANYTVTCFNLLNIQNFVTGYHHLFKQVGFTELTYPAYYNINMLRTDWLEDTRYALRDFAKELSVEIKAKLIDFEAIQHAVQHAIENPPSKEMVKQFWSRTNYMRDVRGIDLAEKIPNAREFLRDE